MSEYDEAKSVELYHLCNRKPAEWQNEAALALITNPSVNVNVTPTIKETRTPLRQACCYGNIELVTALLAHPQVQVNRPGPNGSTPLYMASQEGYVDVVRLLLTHPEIDANKQAKSGLTPLWKAAAFNHVEVVKVLLSHPKIEVNKADMDGMTPLYAASEEGHVDVIKALLLHPAVNVNQANIHKMTPLYIAAQKGHALTVKELLTHPLIDVNLPKYNGITPLYKASQENHVEVVKLLVEHPQIELDKPRFDDGSTPLYIAASYGRERVVQALLASYHKVNVHAKTRPSLEPWREKTAAEQAFEKGWEEMGKLIAQFEEKDDPVLRDDLRKMVGLSLLNPPRLLVITLLISENYYNLKSMEIVESKERNVVRFFSIILNLPLELRMVLCNRVFKSGTNLIRARLIDFSLKSMIQDRSFS